jgi:hypothetical protein
VIDLLSDNAAAARDVLAKAQPTMTRASYLEFQRSIARREVYQA